MLRIAICDDSLSELTSINDILVNFLHSHNIEYEIELFDNGNSLLNSIISFDLILLDPPYGKGLVDDILEFLIVNEMLNDECMIVVEELKEVEFKPFKELDLIKKNDYGITALNVFKYQE